MHFKVPRKPSLALKLPFTTIFQTYFQSSRRVAEHFYGIVYSNALGPFSRKNNLCRVSGLGWFLVQRPNRDLFILIFFAVT